LTPKEQNSDFRLAGELADIGLRFALVILVGTWGGIKLDAWLNSRPWFTIICAALAFAVGFYWLLLRLKGNDPGENSDGD
jgi:ATP synthase protein I